MIEIRAKRFLAMVIDWYITNALASIPVTFYLRGDAYIQSEFFYLETYGLKIGLLLGLYVIALGLIYYIIIPTFVWKGQTFLEGGIVVTVTYFRKIVRLLGYTALVNPLKYIAYTLTLASIIYDYFQLLSQSFHDKIAKTIVIKIG